VSAREGARKAENASSLESSELDTPNSGRFLRKRKISRPKGSSANKKGRRGSDSAASSSDGSEGHFEFTVPLGPNSFIKPPLVPRSHQKGTKLIFDPPSVIRTSSELSVYSSSSPSPEYESLDAYQIQVDQDIIKTIYSETLSAGVSSNGNTSEYFYVYN